MKKLLAWVLVLAVFATFYFKVETTDIVEALSKSREDSITYLLCGYDDAAENTDVIVIADYNFGTNTMTFLQIPRDTYYRGAAASKINSVYPTSKAAGKTGVEALNYLKDELSGALGIEIDDCVGCTMSTFVKLIDAIGGVSLTLPKPLRIGASGNASALELKAGENHLDGRASLMFVRARAGYVTGDIGRVDAQKLFLSAFMRKLKNDVGITDIVKACIATGDGWTVDAKIGDLFKIIAKNRGRISNITTRYVNIPGSQVENSEGVWYYSVSKTAADRLLNELGLERIGAFDPEGILLNASEPSFTEVYNSQSINTTVYDDNSLEKLDVNTR